MEVRSHFLPEFSVSPTEINLFIFHGPKALCASLKPLSNILPYVIVIFVPLSGTEPFENREYLLYIFFTP